MSEIRAKELRDICEDMQYGMGIVLDLDSRIREIIRLWPALLADLEARSTGRDSLRVILLDISLLQARLHNFEEWAEAGLKCLQEVS